MQISQLLHFSQKWDQGSQKTFDFFDFEETVVVLLIHDEICKGFLAELHDDSKFMFSGRSTVMIVVVVKLNRWKSTIVSPVASSIQRVLFTFYKEQERQEE